MDDGQPKKADTMNAQAKEAYNKAGRFFEENRFEEAIDLYSQAIKLDPIYSSAYFNRALSYAMVSRYDNARLDAERVMELEPDSFDAPYVMGLINEYEGKIEDARKWYEKSLNINPNYQPAKVRLEQLEDKFGVDSEQSNMQSTFQLSKNAGIKTGKSVEAEENKTVVEEGQLKRVRWYKSNLSFNDIVGLEKQKSMIYENIILAIRKPELLRAYGKKLGLGVLFYGPPGNGKTYIVNAIAGETQSNVIIVRIHEIVDMYAGNTEKNLHAVFEQARAHTPCILFFDEIDALGMKREGAGEQASYMRMAVNAFLTEMDGVEKNPEGIFVIGATNQPWDMDPALKRSGRFGERIYFPPPNYKARVGAFKYNTRNMPLGRVSFGRLARATMGYSQADISDICDKAALIPAVEEDRTGVRRKVLMKDFLKIIKMHGSTLDEWYGMMHKEIISRTETQIVEGKKTEIVKEGKLTPEEKVQYRPLVKDVKKNSSQWHRLIVRLSRFVALHLF
ncbi:MAG: AAA family ATPase [Candidatus Micrarchaeaceae archaeon]